jgi:hypothetical protein
MFAATSGTDFWPSFAAMVVGASFLADGLVAYYGLCNGKKTWTLWIPKTPATDNSGVLSVFLNVGGRLVGGVGLLAGLVWPAMGIYNNANSWVIFLFAIPGFLNTIKNLLAKKA